MSTGSGTGPGLEPSSLPGLSVVTVIARWAEGDRSRLEGLLGTLDVLGDPWELLVVDDQAGAEAAACLASLAHREPRLRVLTQPRQRGLGPGLSRAFEASTQLVVAVAQPDAWEDLGRVPALFAELRTAEMVGLCAPLDRGALASRWGRALLMRLAHRWLGLDAPKGEPTLCLLRRSALGFLRLQSRGALVMWEILHHLERAGLRARWLAIEDSGVIRARALDGIVRDVVDLRRLASTV